MTVPVLPRKSRFAGFINERVIALGLMQASNMLVAPCVGFVARAHGARAAESNGFLFAFSMVAMCTLFADAGVQMWGVARAGTFATSEVRLHSLAREANSARLLVAALTTVALGGAFYVIGSRAPSGAAVATLALSLAAVAFLPDWLFIARGLSLYSAVAISGARLVAILAVLVIPPSLVTATSLSVLYTGGQLTACIVALVVAYRSFGCGVAMPRLRSALKTLRRTRFLFANRIAATAMSSVNAPILGLVRGPAAAAAYVSCERVITAIGAAVVPWAQSQLPVLAAAFAQSASTLRLAVLRLYGRIVAVGAVLVVTVVGAAYVGAAVAGYDKTLIWLIAALSLTIPVAPMGLVLTQVAAMRGRTGMLMRRTTFSALFHLALVHTAGSVGGADGVAVLFLMSQAIMLALTLPDSLRAQAVSGVTGVGRG